MNIFTAVCTKSVISTCHLGKTSFSGDSPLYLEQHKVKCVIVQDGTSDAAPGMLPLAHEVRVSACSSRVVYSTNITS